MPTSASATIASAALGESQPKRATAMSSARRRTAAASVSSPWRSRNRATSPMSGGLAWALGYPDGEAAPWDEVVAATARIARAVSLPVTADIETGYGDTPEDVARSIGDIVRAGVVGVNLEDGVRSGPAPVRT